MTPDALANLMAESVATEQHSGVPATDAGVFGDAQAWVRIRNMADARLVEAATEMDRRGMARRHGRRLTELLVAVGLVPSVAARIARVSTRLVGLDSAAGDLAEGRMGAEVADAIGAGMAVIERRSGGLDDDSRKKYEAALVAQARSAASPAQLADTARGIANQLAAQSDSGIEPATDRGANEFTLSRTPEGRVALTADVDATSGAVIMAAIEGLAKPRPEPDGSPDARNAGQRRVDALVQLASMTGSTIARAQVSMVVPADAPDLPRVAWMGVVPTATAAVLACDARVEAIVVDGNNVPLAMGRGERTFSPAMKRALEIRDRGCVKCGAPAAWAHAHHIRHWAHGGNTDISNACLLCPACHAAVHNDGWDVVIEFDGHPWLIPPTSVDPKRTPLKSFHRRTMTIAA
ncbi:HNH endonuclease signature motif containing protein [Gordonia jinhuaensis]|uniref:HNH endonuclease n=1 Tax=Gordonia jinhuaensis TaxID=1517702 RepID=A0A916T9G6_9ACTN|nr:HNH endonuclease signature motif containing protein [Gordonia jinhuaensis]GGB36789.1 HNH endonuclease [Gordonia jinhuaensis]